jgi:tetratricopeptide (TPR) repeat protein
VDVRLGEIHALRGDYEQAEARLERALAIKEASLGPDNVAVASTLKALASVFRDSGRLEDAEPLYLRALRIYDRAMDQPDATVRETMQAYARLLHLMDRPSEAAELERRAEAGLNGREPEGS